MQFTAAAIMRLADEGRLKLDDAVALYIPSTPGAGRVTIRDLLTQRSGLIDINSLPDYGDVMRHHQTPATLVTAIEGKPLRFEPGSKYLHAEHSAYNLLTYWRSSSKRSRYFRLRKRCSNWYSSR